MVRLRSQLKVRVMNEGDDEINDCSQIRCTPSIQMPRSKLRLDVQQYVTAKGQADQLKTVKAPPFHWY